MVFFLIYDPIRKVGVRMADKPKATQHTDQSDIVIANQFYNPEIKKFILTKGERSPQFTIVDKDGNYLFTSENPANVNISGESEITGDISVIRAKTEAEHDFMVEGKKVINSDHHYIHVGIANKAFISLSTVGATPVEYCIKTPPLRYNHFKNLALTALGGTCRISVMRGTVANPLVIDSAGTSSLDVIGPNNLNDARSISNASIITKSPSYIEEQKGEPWFILQVVGNSTNQYTSVSNSQISDNEECVMKKDTYYVIKVERIGNDSPVNIFIEMFWYEEEGGYIE